MNFFVSSTTKYRGLYYSYTCKANEAHREILVTIAKYVWGFFQHKETFSVPKKRILKLNCKNITDNTTLIQDLFYLTKNKYYPTIENYKVTFKKSSFFSAFKCDLFRHLLDFNRILFNRNETCQMLTLQAAASARDARLDKSLTSSTPIKSPQGSKSKVSNSSKFLSFSNSDLEPSLPQKEPLSIRQPSQLPSLSSVRSSVEEKVELIAFPTEELRAILKFCKEIHLKDLIKEVDDNATSNNATIFSYLFSLAYDFNGSLASDLLQNNCTGHMALNITRLILNIGYDNCCKFKKFYDDNTQLEDLKNSGKIGQAYLSGLELGNYLNKFYFLPENINLDLTKLILSLLNDRSLFQFLNEDGVMDHLVSLIMSLGIPNLKADFVKRFLEQFVELQQMIIDHSSDPSFSTMSELLEAITLEEESFEERFEAACLLIKDLIPLIKAFAVPKSSTIKNLLKIKTHKIHKPVNANLTIKYNDCRKCFETFKDKSLGNIVPLFVTTPLQTLVNNRRLDQRNFSDTENGLSDHFNSMAFEEFSFQRAKFENFSFSNCYFRGCDFTAASFTGKVSFKKIYVDSQTADSLMKALYAHSNLTIEGIENIYLLTTSLQNEKITPHVSKPNPLVNTSPTLPLNQPWGLVNLTNSCYINATLQIIFNIPSIAQAINLQYQCLSSIQNPYEKIVISSLYNLQQKIYPVGSLEQIRELKNLRLGAYKLNKLKGNIDSQQDAREFLMFILECVNWAPIKTRDLASSTDGKVAEFLGNALLTHNHLFSISVGKESEFQKILNNHFVEYKTEERLIKGIPFKDWKKITLVENDPEYVIVHLDRSHQTITYEEDKVTIKEMILSKVNTVISFPDEVVLSCKQNNKYHKVKYEIVSYLNHIGSTLEGGHYDAFVKNIHDSKWYKCDDTNANSKKSIPKNSFKTSIVVLKKV